MRPALSSILCSKSTFFCSLAQILTSHQRHRSSFGAPCVQSALGLAAFFLCQSRAYLDDIFLLRNDNQDRCRRAATATILSGALEYFRFLRSFCFCGCPLQRGGGEAVSLLSSNQHSCLSQVLGSCSYFGSAPPGIGKWDLPRSLFCHVRNRRTGRSMLYFRGVRCSIISAQ